jgi:acetyltransferase
MYAEAVAALSPRSRYLRFASPLVRLSDRQVDQMTQVDGERHVAYLATTPDGSLAVAVVRYVVLPNSPSSAEAAIAVADEWQGHNLGASLMRHLIEHARSAGLERLCAVTLAENAGAQRLARRTGFAVSDRAGIYVHFELALDRFATAARPSDSERQAQAA